MEYKVIYKGFEVICDSFEALDELTEKARQKSRSAPVKQFSHGTVEPQLRLNLNESENGLSKATNVADDHLKQYIKKLPQSSVDVLQLLVEHRRAMTDTELRTELGLESNMQLAGRISPITRTAQKLGMDANTFFSNRKTDNTPGNRAYEYEISAIMLDRFRDALAES